MAREIKFRAWDKDRHRMVHFRSCSTIQYDDKDAKLIFGENFLDNYTESGTSNFDLMQFTGLLDISDVEIYDEDIVMLRGSIHPTRYRVYWNEDQWDVEDAQGNGYDRGYYENGAIEWNTLEVIGNMRENADMFQVATKE